MKRIVALVLAALLWAPVALAQAAAPATPPATQLAGRPAKAVGEEFQKAADEVLAEISEIVSLPLKEPLKKSIRTREEIRAYLIRRVQEEKEPEKWATDERVLEKLGLLPRGFNLEQFLVELLTEQIAGLYDPKGKEFYIAEWIEAGEQRTVMAHELAHALHDQHFNVEEWMKAAKPDDDAQLARNAVLEGAAMAAMLDYLLREQKLSVRSLPSLEELLRHQMLGEMSSNPQMARAPLVVRDMLMFPYISGTAFAQSVLRAGDGWKDFHRVFTKPPVSTQQIFHPELYLTGVAPRPVALPNLGKVLPSGWKKLDENNFGEFGLRAIFRQFLGEQRAVELGSFWAGDRYAAYEHQKTKRLLLVVLVRLESEQAAARVFGGLSEALELKYPQRASLLRRPNFFAFTSEEGGAYLRCYGDLCLSVEGVGRDVFDKITRALNWPAAPSAPARPSRTRVAATLAQ
jgi:hypothetical protein